MCSVALCRLDTSSLNNQCATAIIVHLNIPVLHWQVHSSSQVLQVARSPSWRLAYAYIAALLLRDHRLAIYMSHNGFLELEYEATTTIVVSGLEGKELLLLPPRNATLTTTSRRR